MEVKYAVMHDIPGRLRVIIPALGDKKDHPEIERMFSSLKGIEQVRIEPLINSMVLTYDAEVIQRNTILQYITLFFKQTRFDPLDHLMVQISPKFRKDLLRSLFSGILILVAYMRKTTRPRPDLLDYAAVISTAYSVLSHGTNRLRHPDVLTGMISMVSLGVNNIQHVAMMTWMVNLLEIFHDIYRSRTYSLL